VLIEASALGVPIAAMKTGGTPDIVADEETGLLSDTPAELAEDVRRLRADEQLRGRLGEAARSRAADLFDAAATTRKVEQLCRELLQGQGR
jgi:glycosyltransferase involved in cell wall biosynthesis